MRSKADSPQLFELTRAVPKKFIKTPPAGKQGSYVPHFVVTQWILATLGPFDWELVQILRGLVEPTYYTKVEDGHAIGDVKREGLEDAVVGAVYRLTVMIDGQRVVIEEIGSCDSGPHERLDGQRLKKAASDAMKRCGMRLGIAIQLWCKTPDEFFVNSALNHGAAGLPKAPDELVLPGDQDDEDDTEGTPR